MGLNLTKFRYPWSYCPVIPASVQHKHLTKTKTKTLASALLHLTKILKRGKTFYIVVLVVVASCLVLFLRANLFSYKVWKESLAKNFAKSHSQNLNFLQKKSEITGIWIRQMFQREVHFNNLSATFRDLLKASGLFWTCCRTGILIGIIILFYF